MDILFVLYVILLGKYRQIMRYETSFYFQLALEAFMSPTRRVAYIQQDALKSCDARLGRAGPARLSLGWRYRNLRAIHSVRMVPVQHTSSFRRDQTHVDEYKTHHHHKVSLKKSCRSCNKFSRRRYAFVIFCIASCLALVERYRTPKRARFIKEKIGTTRGKALYINLAERIDRRESIELQLSSAGFDFERIEAISIRNQNGTDECWGNRYCAGQVGCQLSHMRALQYAMRARMPFVTIFEDDFAWLPHVSPFRIQQTLLHIQEAVPDWDVIAISLNVLQSVPVNRVGPIHVGNNESSVIVRIVEAQATHGYMVKGSYMAHIYDAFKNCDIFSEPLTAIDTCWKPLQTTGKWYGLAPQLGHQAPGYSDIEGKNVHYSIA